MRTVAHLDMDAFYVSVELGRRPELHGLPVIVCGSGPRAVVTTASYEARRYGVASAMPAARARRLCPDAVTVSPDFEAYRTMSHEVMAILRANVDRVQVVGLDEAYLDLSGILSPKATMRRIVAEIRERTGLGCSVGIAPSRLLAKIASELDKPGGLVSLTREQALERFAKHSPGLVPGIGPKTVARLEGMDIRTLGQLRAAPVDRLQVAFGSRQGLFLQARAGFEDDTPVTVAREAKSQSSETTFDEDVVDPARLAGTLDRLTEHLCTRLKDRELRGRTVGIKVRLDDFSTHTRARTLPERVHDPATVGAVARELLAEFAPGRPVRLLGVRVAGLQAPFLPEKDQLELPVD